MDVFSLNLCLYSTHEMRYTVTVTGFSHHLLYLWFFTILLICLLVLKSFLLLLYWHNIVMHRHSRAVGTTDDDNEWPHTFCGRACPAESSQTQSGTVAPRPQSAAAPSSSDTHSTGHPRPTHWQSTDCACYPRWQPLSTSATAAALTQR